MNSNPEMELQSEVHQIYQFIEPYKPGNKFKFMLYNFIPRGQQVRMLQEIRHQPAEGGLYYQVDTTLHSEAISKNPDPDRLYPWQINSCKDLLGRVRMDSKTVDLFDQNLETIQAKLSDSEVDFGVKTAEMIRKVSERQSKLMERICITRQKLEKFLEVKKALAKDSGMEMRLFARLEEIKKKLEIRSRIEKIDCSVIAAGKKVEVPYEKTQQLIAVLHQQRSGVMELKKRSLAIQSKEQNIEAVLEKYKNK